MFKPLVIMAGKSLKRIAKIRGGGTALPGLVVEKIDSKFVADSLAKLPLGVVVVSGTNGKTTTTKIIVELLQMSGIKVFSNRTGSNFTRGIAASLLDEISLSGKLASDIAVLELDEAHAVNFAKLIKPRFLILLNVMRDQLDRFGEIDSTANMLSKIAQYTSTVVVLNREDPLIYNIHNQTKAKVIFYGLSSNLKRFFPSDDELHNKDSTTINYQEASVVLSEINKDIAGFLINNRLFRVRLKINGIYNLFNSAGALALVREIIKAKDKDLITNLAKISPAFGRGEKINFSNKTFELVLVKNPSGFRLGLESFAKKTVDTLIIINDSYADGCDVSWLWDVDFTKLNANTIFVSGSRADDMSLRLHYDNKTVQLTEPNIKKSLKQFIKTDSKNKLIFCTYSAMLTARKFLTQNKQLGEN